MIRHPDSDHVENFRLKFKVTLTPRAGPNINSRVFEFIMAL